MKAMIRPERMTEAEGLALVTEWERSQLSISAFCRGRGLSAHRLSYWKRRRKDSAVPSGPCTEFMVASVEELRTAQAPVNTAAFIEVLVGERFRIRVPAYTRALEDILMALGAVSR